MSSSLAYETNIYMASEKVGVPAMNYTFLEYCLIYDQK